MGAELPVVAPDAVIDAEEICVGTVDALAQRDAYLGYGRMTGIAKREEIPAFDVMRAGFERGVVLDMTVDPAAHEDMLVCVNVSLDLLQAFVDPVNTVATVNHLLSDE